MCVQSNYYRLLDNCLIQGSPLYDDAKLQKVNFSLAEFINDSNDEIYHRLNYSLDLDQAHFASHFSKEQLPLLKIIVVDCHFLDRNTIETVIGCDLDIVAKTIKLKPYDDEPITFELHAENECEDKVIPVFDIDFFLKNLEESIFIDNHWITALFFDPVSQKGIIPNDAFIEQFGVKLT